MKTILWAGVWMALAGCATTDAIRLKTDRSTVAIRAAQELGASTDPKARIYLQRAMDEQDAARRLANVGDERATSLLACAEADADLAVALARESAARHQEQQLATEVNALRAQGVTP